MARRLRDKTIDSREARRKLPISSKPHWRAIGKDLHLGYRKGKRGGVWVVRRYAGEQSYKVKTIGIADDTEDANSNEVLTFWQAEKIARGLRETKPRGAAYTVADAIDDYLAEHLEP